MIRQRHGLLECAIIVDEQTANINNEWIKREQSRCGCDNTILFEIAHWRGYENEEYPENKRLD